MLSGLRGMGRWFLTGRSGDSGRSGLGHRTAPLILMMEACDRARRGMPSRDGDERRGAVEEGGGSDGR